VSVRFDDDSFEQIFNQADQKEAAMLLKTEIGLDK
jgi:hypothetical protein